MRTNVRQKSRYMEGFRRNLLNHININLKDYLILSIIFIIGVMIGVVVINNSDEQSKSEINGYINSFVETIKKEEFEIDRTKLIKTSILDNLKIVGIIWLAGSTIIGIPIIYIIMAYKGFCVGYTISAIISSLGLGKRNCIFSCLIIFAEYNRYTYSTYA